MKFIEVELPSNRKFGLFFTGIFVLVGAYFSYKGSSNLAMSFFGVTVAFLIVTLAKAELLLPLNKLWMRLGLLLGMIVSPIIMGIIFFALFTPIGLLMRLFGRDELRLKLKPSASYWKVREPNGSATDSFKHQF